MKFAVCPSLQPVLACGVFGVGSVKVDGRLSGATSCVGQWCTCFSVRCSVRAGFLSLWELKCVIINPEELCVWEK
jgi:hypothetical protein